MAAPFRREVLDRIVADKQAEKVKFKNGRTAIVDMFSASLLVQACEARPDLEYRILDGAQQSGEAMGRLVGLLASKVK